ILLRRAMSHPFPYTTLFRSDVGTRGGDGIGYLGHARLVRRVDGAGTVVHHFQTQGFGGDLRTCRSVETEVAGDGGDGDGARPADVIADVADGVLDLDAVRGAVMHQVGVVLGVDPTRVPGERHGQDVVLLESRQRGHRVRRAGRVTDHRHLIAHLLVFLEVGRHVVRRVLDEQLHLEAVDATVAVHVLRVDLGSGDDRLRERREGPGKVRQPPELDHARLVVDADVRGDVACRALVATAVAGIGRRVLARVACGVGSRVLGRGLRVRCRLL